MKKIKHDQRHLSRLVKTLQPLVRKEVDRGVKIILAELKSNVRHVRPAYTQRQVVDLLSEACRRKGLPQAALSLRTIQRMESNPSQARSGYSVEVRSSRTDLFAWMQAYLAEESARLDPKRAVRYNEGLLAHQSGLA